MLDFWGLVLRHSGDWLFATPVPSCGLFLSDEEVRIAVGLRIGLPLILPHVCMCGGMMDSQGLHGLACIRGSKKHARHSIINDVVYRSMARAKVQSIKEPPGLCRDGKRPDGASIIPWRRGRDVTWDVTVADTFAASGQALLQSERWRRKLRSTMNCVAITFSSRWLAK